MPQPRYVQLPNGSYLEWPEGVSAADFKAKAQKVMGAPETWQKSESPRSQGPQTPFAKLFDKTAEATVNAEPVILGTLGSVVGGMVAGPVGATVGATVGAGTGEAAKQHAHGQDTSQAPQVKDQLKSAAAGGLTELGGYGATKALGAAARWMRPVASERIVPLLEQASRKFTNAINPNPVEADQFIQNVGKQMPNILDYAKKTGNPLNTRIEFAKAAEGAGKESYEHFVKNFLSPIEDKQVSIAGTGFKGKTVGEGQRATIGEINKRLNRLNTELSPAYRARNAGVVGSNLASEADLQAEAGALRKIINKEVGKASGLSPEEVGAMRQRYGELQHIARSTNEAVTQKSLSAAKGTTGTGIPSVKGLPVKAAEYVRGGADAIADRAFKRALKEFPEGEAIPLQQPPKPSGKVTKELMDIRNKYRE